MSAKTPPTATSRKLYITFSETSPGPCLINTYVNLFLDMSPPGFKGDGKADGEGGDFLVRPFAIDGRHGWSTELVKSGGSAYEYESGRASPALATCLHLHAREREHQSRF